MKFKFPSLLATFLISCIIKTSVGERSCNDFVDEVLKDIMAQKEYFAEPYEIPENERSFAVYQLEYGHIYGLSTLHRYNDVITKKSGKNPYLKVHLAAGEINVKSAIKRKFLAFGKTANVDATMPFVEVTFDIVPRTNGSEPKIKDFKIDEIKGLSVKVSGVGLIRDFFLNAFISLAGRFFQNAVKNAIEDKLKRFLKNKVLEYSIPAECLNNAWE